MASLLKARGLNTFDNELAKPEGSLDEANNTVINKQGVIEPRRGFKQYGSSMPTVSDRAKQLFSYKGRLLRHYYDNATSKNKIQYDNGSGTFTSFEGEYDELETGLRIKGVEANGNFYFTTINGVKKISANTASDLTSATGFITNAGGIKALDLTADINYTSAGFFNADTGVAYRILWGYKDNNSNLILGTPSSRAVIFNLSLSETAVVDITFTVPEEITNDSFFYQIYRSPMSIGTNEPSDELQLVLEEFVTTAEIVTGTVTLTDIVPDDFREGGTLLYTNSTVEGIAQANEKPPLCKDIALFKGSTFYANTKTIHRKEIALLTVSDLISNTSSISIIMGATTGTYTFRGATETTLVNTTGATGAIPASLDGSYFLLNSYSNKRKYFAWYKGTTGTIEPTGGSTSGRLGIEIDISAVTGGLPQVATLSASAINLEDDFNSTYVSGNIFSVNHLYNGNVTDAVNGTVSPQFAYTITQGSGEDASTNKVLISSLPTVSQAVDETARSLVNIINQDDNCSVYAYYLSGPDDVPGQILLESRTLTDTEFYVKANSILTGDSFNPSLPTSGQDVISSNEESKNRVFYSKYQIPEAVPILNYFDVGPKDKEIVRIVPLRDNLFIFKEDGVYQLSGSNGNFSVFPFDSSAKIVAPDSATVLNNQAYALTSIGVISVSDTGVSVISRDIEDQLLKIQSNAYTNFQTSTFSVPYESDKSYMLWSVSKEDDTTATQCFRFNSFTNAWTKWPITKTCGIVHDADDKLYLGPSDLNYIEQERKSFGRTDYADRQYDLSFSASAVNSTNNTLIISSVTNAKIGDVVSQVQYVTIPQFNQLLSKLDNDAILVDSDYYSTLSMTSGDNLSSKMTLLVAKLNADSTVSSYTFSGATSFSTIQTEFNTMITTLNSDTGVFFTDYEQSTDTIEKEAIIEGVNKSLNKLTLDYMPEFIQGPIILYSGYEIRITWSPLTYGDPEYLKQIYDGKIAYKTDIFTSAVLSYATDLSPSFYETTISGRGVGAWGLFPWGNQTWGGLGTSVPIRTFIPLEKQRCRFLRTRVKHINARQQFEILGIANTARVISEKAYR